jgi:serine/threonine protein kinase/Tol biopolymer transport system component
MIGSRLAHYEITAHLGSGGMGEVYQATDSKLGRAVAIKMLPVEFTREPERVARLQREARVLASLNHPSIAIIHGIEDSEGHAFLVMELVPGETLEERIGSRPLPVAEALRIAVQIAAALEAAHESGVVHRDLKPANVKIRTDGSVKLLDFGIAKATSVALTGAVRATTLVGEGSRFGAVTGTPAYMSPEQARGQTVDRRTDIFAFGCVLYEMLTGHRAFDGETLTDTIAQVVAVDPDWSRLPQDLAPRVRELVERCLEKDPRKRRRDSGDVRLDLERALLEPPWRSVDASALAHLERRSKMRGLIAVGATAGLVLAVAGAVALWGSRETPTPARFTFFSAPTVSQPASVAVSPDGRYVAYVVRSTTPPTPSLFVRAIDSFEAKALEGTEGASGPFWSPDSRHIAFGAPGGEGAVLKRIALAGGPPQVVARLTTGIAGGAWSAEDVVVFTSGDALWRVPATGGEPVEIARVDGPAGERFFLMHTFLPDGRRFLYASPWPEPGRVYAQSFDSAERTEVLPFAARTQYADGFLLFNREGTVFAQRFDADRLTVRAEPTPLSRGAWFAGLNGQAKFGASPTALAYEIAAEVPRELTRLAWYDRTGALLGTLGEPADYQGVALSPNARYVAVHRHEGSTTNADTGDLWVADRERNTFTRLDSGMESASTPIWSPDGKELAYLGDNLNIYRQDASGAGHPKLVVQSQAFGAHPYDWLGETILFAHTAGGVSSVAAAGDSTPTAITHDSFQAGVAELSPDGRWIAYGHNQSGRPEIYVRPYPETTRQWLVSTAGGSFPRWTRNGRELVYVAPDNTFMAVDIAIEGDELVPGTPYALFKAGVSREFHNFVDVPYDVSIDGERFIVNEPVPAAGDGSAGNSNEIAVVLNWAPEP